MDILRWSFAGVFRCITLSRGSTLFFSCVSYLKTIWPQTVFRNLQMKGKPGVPISLKFPGTLVTQVTSANRTSKPFKIAQLKKIKVVTSLGFSNTLLLFYGDVCTYQPYPMLQASSGGRLGCSSLTPALPSNFAACLLKLDLIAHPWRKDLHCPTCLQNACHNVWAL